MTINIIQIVKNHSNYLKNAQKSPKMAVFTPFLTIFRSNYCTYKKYFFAHFAILKVGFARAFGQIFDQNQQNFKNQHRQKFFKFVQSPLLPGFCPLSKTKNGQLLYPQKILFELLYPQLILRFYDLKIHF